MQVVGGVRDRRVPQIGLKDRQQRADVPAVCEPGPQVVASHRVAQIMDTGPVPAAAVGDPGLPQKPPEVVVDVHQRQRLPGRLPGKNHSWLPDRPAACA